MPFPRRTILAVAAFATAALPVSARAGGNPGTGAAGSPVVSAGWRTVLTVSAGQQLSSLAIDLRGVATQPKWTYTVDTTTGRIVKFGTGGKRILSWSYGKPAPAGTRVGLAVGGSGNVFMADPIAGTVTKFSPSGRLLVRWAGFALPTGVAVDRAGRVFVAEQDVERVTELSPSGKVLARWSPSSIYSPGGPSAPIDVATGPRGEIWIATSCVVGASCGPGTTTGTAASANRIDGLLEVPVRGPQRGRPVEMLFGLPYTTAGATQPPDKESEPFVGIGAMSSDSKGWLYVAGTIWWRGGNPRVGVLAYTPFVYKWDTLYLPTQRTPHGVAVDGRGIAYVAQGNRILARPLGKRPGSPTG